MEKKRKTNKNKTKQKKTKKKNKNKKKKKKKTKKNQKTEKNVNKIFNFGHCYGEVLTPFENLFESEVDPPQREHFCRCFSPLWSSLS